MTNVYSDFDVKHTVNSFNLSNIIDKKEDEKEQKVVNCCNEDKNLNKEDILNKNKDSGDVDLFNKPEYNTNIKNRSGLLNQIVLYDKNHINNNLKQLEYKNIDDGVKVDKEIEIINNINEIEINNEFITENNTEVLLIENFENIFEVENNIDIIDSNKEHSIGNNSCDKNIISKINEEKNNILHKQKNDNENIKDTLLLEKKEEEKLKDENRNNHTIKIENQISLIDETNKTKNEIDVDSKTSGNKIEEKELMNDNDIKDKKKKDLKDKHKKDILIDELKEIINKEQKNVDFNENKNQIGEIEILSKSNITNLNLEKELIESVNFINKEKLNSEFNDTPNNNENKNIPEFNNTSNQENIFLNDENENIPEFTDKLNTENIFKNDENQNISEFNDSLNNENIYKNKNSENICFHNDTTNNENKHKNKNNENKHKNNENISFFNDDIQNDDLEIDTTSFYNKSLLQYNENDTEEDTTSNDSSFLSFNLSDDKDLQRKKRKTNTGVLSEKNTNTNKNTNKNLNTKKAISIEKDKTDSILDIDFDIQQRTGQKKKSKKRKIKFTFKNKSLKKHVSEKQKNKEKMLEIITKQNTIKATGYQTVKIVYTDKCIFPITNKLEKHRKRLEFRIYNENEDSYTEKKLDSELITNSNIELNLEKNLEFNKNKNTKDGSEFSNLLVDKNCIDGKNGYKFKGKKNEVLVNSVVRTVEYEIDKEFTFRKKN